MGKFALTEVQLAYMLGRNDEFESGNVATHYYNEINNNLDTKRFEKALNKVIKKHKMLHTVIHTDASQEELKVYPYYEVKYHDLSGLGDEEKESERLKIRERMSHKNYEIGTWPMFGFEIAKLSEDKKILFVSIDLIISDAGSIMILFNDLYRYYTDETMPVNEEKVTFKDFVEYMEKMKTGDKYKQDKAWWMEQIMELPMGPSLRKKKDADEEDTHFSRLTYISEGDEWKKFRENIMRHGLIQTTYLCECYREVLAYYSGNGDFSINLTTTNRGKLEGTENVIGDFTSLTIFPMPDDHTSDIWENAGNLQKKLLEVYSHASFDGIDVEREFRKHHNLKSEIPFPVVFTSLMGGGKEEFDREFFESADFSVSQTSQVYLDCQVSEEEDTLIVTWDYPSGRFEEGMMKEMFDEFVSLIKMASPENTESDIYEVLKPSKEDIGKITAYNQTSLEINSVTLGRMIAEKAKLYSSNTAIIDENNRINYSDALTEVKKIASFLKEKGLNKGDVAAVIGNKNAKTIEMIWACAYMGIIFVPIHPEYPKDRRDYIISDSRASLVLDTECDEQMAEIENTKLTNDIEIPEDVSMDSYIIYTSGSTGNPKGVVITNDAVYNTLYDMNRRFEVTEDDKIINISELGFDLSVYDIFGTVLAGACVVINRDVRDIEEIYRNMEENKVTIWNSVPSIYNLILDYAEKNGRLLELKKVFLSGDWIPVDIYEKNKRIMGDVELISLGGATEGSIWSIWYRIQATDEVRTSIPYGYPLANQQMFVLDENRRLLPVGVSGEIYIGGRGVAKGYTSDDITKTAFYEHEEYGRIYKTGDAGVFEPEGYITILGRMDNQVKINGYRIETQEIEQAILRVPEIENAYVEISTKGRAKRIIAFVHMKKEVTEDDIDYIKDEIKKTLPAYMIPNHICPLNEIPLNSNGKIDRKVLRKMADSIEVKSVSYKKPENEIQEILFDAWSDMLSHYEFGINTDFFDAGGDSLLMIYNLTWIQERFGVKIKGREFLENATIEEIAKIIKERAGK